MTMKKLLKFIPAIALIAVFSSTTYAQQSISASATVLDAIAFGTHSNLAFGEIIAGNSATIAADSSAAGYFEITGYESTKTLDVSVTETSPTFGGTGSVTLSLATLRYSFAASADATSSTIVTGGNVSLASQTSNLYLYVGGTLNATGATAGGAYSSTIELTVDYL